MTNRRQPKPPVGETSIRHQPARSDQRRRAAPSAKSKTTPIRHRGGGGQGKAHGAKGTRARSQAATGGGEPTARAARLPLYAEPARKRRSRPSCTACGLCCSYVAIEVDSPATVKQATQLLWYVYHEGVSLYVNDDEWMVQFDTTCVHLQPDYRCGVYETRPHICREFSEQDCEVNTGDDGQTFYTATEFVTHLQTTRPRIYAMVMKNFAPPVEPERARLSPFEHRFQAVRARRRALGI